MILYKRFLCSCLLVFGLLTISFSAAAATDQAANPGYLTGTYDFMTNAGNYIANVGFNINGSPSDFTQHGYNGKFTFDMGSMPWPNTFSAMCDLYAFTTQTNGTISLYPKQIYALNVGFFNQSRIISVSLFSPKVGLKVVSSSGNTVFFYVDETVSLSSMVWLVRTDPFQLNTVYGPNNALLTNTGFSYCNVQTITGFTGEAGAESIVQAIENQTGSLNDKTDEQYNIDPNDSGSISNFGGGQSDAVAGKLSALDYASEISSQMVSLFAETPGPPVLTFPAFHMDIDGQTYDIWQDIDFDFSSLLPDFEVLISAIRFILVALCYIAFVKFLQGVYTSIIHNKTLEEGVDES